MSDTQDKMGHLGLVNGDGTQTKIMPLPILEEVDLLNLKLLNVSLSDAKKGVELAQQALTQAHDLFIQRNQTNLAFIGATNNKYRDLGFKAFDLRMVTVDDRTGKCVFNPEGAARLAQQLKQEKMEEERPSPKDSSTM